MIQKLVEKTGPSVQLESSAQSKGERTRERILDFAYEAIVQKGFAATSIEELVEAAGITKSGFFYHFKDKNDLARQLFDRFLTEDETIIETLEKRARALSDDPLQSFLIFLNLYAQMMDDMTGIIKIAKSIPSLPSIMWTACFLAAISCVCTIRRPIQAVKTSPWNMTAGGSVGLGRG